MEAPERYAILARYGKADGFIPVVFPHNQVPDGGYFEWDKAVQIRNRLCKEYPDNGYMVAPVVADPIC